MTMALQQILQSELSVCLQHCINFRHVNILRVRREARNLSRKNGGKDYAADVETCGSAIRIKKK